MFKRKLAIYINHLDQQAFHGFCYDFPMIFLLKPPTMSIFHGKIASSTCLFPHDFPMKISIFWIFHFHPPQTSNGRRQRPRRRGVAPGGGRHRGDAGGGAARLRSGRELPGDVAGKPRPGRKVSHWEGLIFFIWWISWWFLMVKKLLNIGEFHGMMMGWYWVKPCHFWVEIPLMVILGTVDDCFNHIPSIGWLVVSDMAFIFRNIWDNPSHWLIFFQRGRCTTNQFLMKSWTISWTQKIMGKSFGLN